jgi:hypothetical protein
MATTAAFEGGPAVPRELTLVQRIVKVITTTDQLVIGYV